MSQVINMCLNLLKDIENRIFLHMHDFPLKLTHQNGRINTEKQSLVSIRAVSGVYAHLGRAMGSVYGTAQTLVSGIMTQLLLEVPQHGFLTFS